LRWNLRNVLASHENVHMLCNFYDENGMVQLCCPPIDETSLDRRFS
jgi:hypothetical protein